MTIHAALRVARRFFTTMFAAALLAFATAAVADAEVIDSGHVVSTNVVTNPCDLGDGLIVLTTDSRWETRLQPDGTLITHFVNQSEGVSANGTRYVANRQATSTTPAGSTAVEVEVEIVRVSAGPGPNAIITITGTLGGPLTTTVRCVG
jgi:hypothetical protein